MTLSLFWYSISVALWLCCSFDLSLFWAAPIYMTILKCYDFVVTHVCNRNGFWDPTSILGVIYKVHHAIFDKFFLPCHTLSKFFILSHFVTFNLRFHTYDKKIEECDVSWSLPLPSYKLILDPSPGAWRTLWMALSNPCYELKVAATCCCWL